MLKLLNIKFNKFVSDTQFSEILTGSIWAFGARVVAAVTSMISSMVIARFYGAEVMGLMAVINSFLMFTSIFSVLGTNTSILRFIPEHLTKYSPTSAFIVYRKIQLLIAVLAVFIGSILFCASGVISETIFSKSHLKYYLALGAFCVVFKSLMDFNTQAIRGLRLIKVFAFMQLLPTLSQLVILLPITILVYHRDNPVYAMFASIVITALAGILIMDRIFKKKLKRDDTLHPMPIKEILNISLPMLMTTTVSFIIGQTGVLMLGLFRPEADVGYFAIAVKLGTMTSFILASINTIAAPKFSELYQNGNIDHLFYIAKKSAKLAFWLSFPILLITVFVGEYLLVFLFGHDFSKAYPVLILLLIGQFFSAISGATTNFMNMTGNHNALKNIMFIVMLCNVVMNIVLISYFGLLGAGISAMVSMILKNMSVLIFTKVKYGKSTGYFPQFKSF